MRFLVLALAMIFVGCSTHNQLGSGDGRGSSPPSGPETTVHWLDKRGGFPSVGYFDVETVFNESDLGPGSYVRVASLHITGTSQTALLGALRLKASEIGANRLLIVRAEEKKEEVHLYSRLENVARFFSGEKTGANRKDVAYTLRIDAIAIRQSDSRSTLAPPRPRDDRSAVYRPYRPGYRSPVKPPRRPGYRSPLKPPRRRDDQRSVRPPRQRDDRPPVKSPPPKDDQPSRTPPPPKDDRPTEKPPPSRDVPSTVYPHNPDDDRPVVKLPRPKTHRP